MKKSPKTPKSSSVPQKTAGLKNTKNARFFCPEPAHVMPEESMKKSRQGTLALVFAAALATSLLLLLPQARAAEIYEDTVRFHVVANSDGAEDQMIKKTLYTALCEEYGDELSFCVSTAECREKISRLLPEIEAFANRELERQGEDRRATVSWSDRHYDRTEYMGRVLPAGEYRALCVVIGEGAGHNCFSVLFPQMSMWISTPAPDIDDICGIRADGVIYEARLRTLEWLNDVFSR